MDYSMREVAEGDISVFKVVRGRYDYGRGVMRYVSLYRLFPYEVGSVYRTEMSVDGFSVSEGFHSYMSSEVSVVEDGFLSFMVRSSIGGGKKLLSASCGIYAMYVMECVIPSGSSYYRNRYGEVVSDCLRVVGCEEISDYVGKMGFMKEFVD